MRTFFTLAALTAFAAAATATDPKPAASNEKSGIEGGYTFRSGEEDGKTVPGERLQGSTVRITPTDIVVTDAKKKEMFVAKYDLDTSATPWKITLRGTVPAEMKVGGLAEKKGQELRIIYAMPGADTPTDFTTKKGQHLFVMEKIKKEGEGFNPGDGK